MYKTTLVREPYMDPRAESILANAPVPRRALFLDRDGVINVDHGYVHTPEETQWMPGIFDLVRAACGKGFLPIVVTNQAGIARGYYSEQQFLDYTAWVHTQFAAQGAPLVATFWCPHHPDAGVGSYNIACECRKPKPGMIEAALCLLDCDASGSLLIGDKESDLQAGLSAGVGRVVNVQHLDGKPSDWMLDESRKHA